VVVARRHVRPLFVLVVAVVATLALASRAQAAPGDVYLADSEAGSGSQGAIFKFGPSGGAPALLTDSTAVDGTSGLTLDPVTGLLLGANYTNVIHTIDRITGAVGVYATGPATAQYSDMVVAPNGQIYAADGQNSEIDRIDPATKAVVPVASGFFEPFSDYMDSIVASRDGKLYVSDESSAVYEIDAKTGAARVLAHDAQLAGADGMALSPDDKVLYVAGFCMPVLDCPGSTGPPNQVAVVSLSSGAVATVATVSDSVAVSVRTDGSLLSTNTNTDSLQIVPLGGTPITDFTTPGDPLDYPHDTVIEPDLCAGKIPTVVGTIGPDTLTGSPFADVISTLGGKDTVKAGGGNDIVCGGTGKDRLFGQGGRDRLLGQAGKDVLNGGKKKDVLKGGKGSDNCRTGKGDKLRSC
jgi:hypothetical protein